MQSLGALRSRMAGAFYNEWQSLLNSHTILDRSFQLYSVGLKEIYISQAIKSVIHKLTTWLAKIHKQKVPLNFKVETIRNISH